MAISHCLLNLVFAALTGTVLAGPAQVEQRQNAGATITLTVPPLITEVVPYFSTKETTITKAGTYTLGVGSACLDLLGINLGCIGTVVTVKSSSVCTVTGIDTSTTTFPCSTATTFTSNSHTYCWRPTTSACSSVAPVTSTVTTVSNFTATVTATSVSTATAVTTTTETDVTVTTAISVVTATTVSVTTETDTTVSTETTTETDTTVSTATVVSTEISVTTTTVTGTCSTPPPLSCDKHGYLIQYETLYQVDLATGATTTISTNVGSVGSINAIGYNVLDNYMYGVGATSETLVRIGSDGTATNILANAANPGPNVGDVDNSGTYWYSSAGSTWGAIDLAPGSPTYLQSLGQGTMDNLGYAIADWVYIPVAGPYLWTIGELSGSSALMQWSMASKTWTVVSTYAKVGTGFGAVYGMNNGTGTLYASDNGSGYIYRFFLNSSAPVVVSHGPAAGNNDGARCVLNLNV